MFEVFLLFLFNAAFCLCCIYIAGRSKLSPYSKSVTNPVSFFLILQLLSCALFLSGPSSGYIDHARYVYPVNMVDYKASYFYFTVMNSALCLGLTLPFFLQRGVGSVSLPRIESNIGLRASVFVKIVFWASILVCALYIFLIIGVKSISSAALYASDRFNAGSGALLVYMTTFIRIFFLPYILTRRVISLESFLALFFVVIICLVSGSRINLMSIAFCYLIRMQYAGVIVDRKFIILAFPLMAIVGVFLRFVTRAHKNFSSVTALVEESGGWLELILNPFEIFTHKLMPILVAGRFEVERYIGESVISLILLPVPSNIIPGKSQSVSIEFSKVFDPNLWYAVKSQITLGGLAEAYLEYGVVVSIFFLMIFGWVYASIYIKSMRSAVLAREIIVLALLLAAFTFVRGGIVHLGLVIWPTLMCIIVMKFIACLDRKGRGLK